MKPTERDLMPEEVFMELYSDMFARPQVSFKREMVVELTEVVCECTVICDCETGYV